MKSAKKSGQEIAWVITREELVYGPGMLCKVESKSQTSLFCSILKLL